MILADHPQWKRVAGPLAIVMLGLWPAIRSYSLGPDVQVDFGRELYAPWRVSEGASLYGDVAYFNGPLSVYWHALWFKLAGVGLSTIKVANLFIVAGIVVFIVKLGQRAAGSLAAYAAACFFVGAMAFGQVLNIGNYDFLTPYSHELTHGIALSLWGIYEFARRNEPGRAKRSAILCGAILGLVFLTKLEVFFAFGLSIFVGFALELRTRTESSPPPVQSLGMALGAFALVIATAFAGLALGTGFDNATAGLLEPIRAVFGTNVVGLTYYQWVMGTRDLADSISKIGVGLGVYAVALAALILISITWRRLELERFTPLAGLVFLGACLLFPLAPVHAVHSIRPFAVIVPFVLIALVFRASVYRRADLILPATVLAFGFGLQIKMLLNAQFGHYGFALLMPSTLAMIVALLGYLPKWIEKRGGSAPVFQLAALALLLSVGLGLNDRAEINASRRTEPVGQAPDVMMSDFRADNMLRALYFLEGTDPSATVAVLPEGIMLNYLARRQSPTRYINFMPPEFSLYGSDAIVEAFRNNPPDYMLFVHKRTGLYGFPFFGKDYGQNLYQWATDNYQLARQIGETPFNEATRFGITILERRDKQGTRP